MQSPKEEDKQQSAGEQKSARQAELSEAWRALLGLQPSSSVEDGQQVDPAAAEVQPQDSDPWSALLRAKGMEAVDLQKIHLHALHPTASDEDIEHALNLMQEATGQLPAPEKKPGQA